MQKQNRDGILPWPWQNLQSCMISLGISVPSLVDYGDCCLTFPPECCIPKWVRLSRCCAMKTRDRGVRAMLGAMNIPHGCYSSCRRISIIVGTVLHSTALFFACLYTWWCLSCVWGSALQKFSLPVACSGGAYQKRTYQDFWRGNPTLEFGGRRRCQPPLLTNLVPGWPLIHLLHMHKQCSSHDTAVLVSNAREMRRTVGPGCGNMIHYWRILFNVPAFVGTSIFSQ